MVIYFDHNATTPLHPEVLNTMMPYFQNQFGNASCLYQLGVDASYAVEKARMRVARLINAKEDEIVFTSGGTESDNLAIKGVFFSTDKKHIITSAIEHPAVTVTCQFLRDYFNADITTLPVDTNGQVNPNDIATAIKPETTLISIMLANNEIGTIQPIKQIAEIAQEHGILFHTDAVQAAGKVSIDVDELGVDLLSLSAHKFNGPKGVGALYVKEGTTLAPFQTGGGHEQGLRGGTENVPGIAGMGQAAVMAQKNLSDKAAKTVELREYFWEQLYKLNLGIIRNSPQHDALPGTLNVTIPGVNARELVRAMDQEGFCIASGSACSTGKPTPSTVITAIGRSTNDALSSIRLSLSNSNTHDEIDMFTKVLPTVIQRLTAHQII